MLRIRDWCVEPLRPDRRLQPIGRDQCSFALERNQQDGSEHSATIVRVLKNRYSGETGIAAKLEYNLATCSFKEYEAQPDFNASTDF